EPDRARENDRQRGCASAVYQCEKHQREPQHPPAESGCDELGEHRGSRALRRAGEERTARQMAHLDDRAQAGLVEGAAVDFHVGSVLPLLDVREPHREPPASSPLALSAALEQKILSLAYHARDGHRTAQVEPNGGGKCERRQPGHKKARRPECSESVETRHQRAFALNARPRCDATLAKLLSTLKTSTTFRICGVSPSCIPRRQDTPVYCQDRTRASITSITRTLLIALSARR